MPSETTGAHPIPPLFPLPLFAGQAYVLGGKVTTAATVAIGTAAIGTAAETSLEVSNAGVAVVNNRLGLGKTLP